MKTILVDAYRTLIHQETRKVDMDLFTLLERCPQNKIIVTNATTEKQVELGIVDPPYELFTLNSNPSKESPAYYTKLLAHYKLNPKDILYIEHNPKAIVAAQNVGIFCVPFDPDVRDIEIVSRSLKKYFSLALE